MFYFFSSRNNLTSNLCIEKKTEKQARTGHRDRERTTRLVSSPWSRYLGILAALHY